MPKVDSKKCSEASKRKTRSASDTSNRPKSCPKSSKARPLKVRSSSSATLASDKPSNTPKPASPAHVQPSLPEKFFISVAPAFNTPMLLRSNGKLAEASQEGARVEENTSSPLKNVPPPSTHALTPTAANFPIIKTNSFGFADQNTITVKSVYGDTSKAEAPSADDLPSPPSPPLSLAFPPSTGVAQGSELEHVETLFPSVSSTATLKDATCTFLGAEDGFVPLPIDSTLTLPPPSAPSTSPPPHCHFIPPSTSSSLPPPHTSSAPSPLPLPPTPSALSSLPLPPATSTFLLPPTPSAPSSFPLPSAPSVPSPCTSSFNHLPLPPPMASSPSLLLHNSMTSAQAIPADVKDARTKPVASSSGLATTTEMTKPVLKSSSFSAYTTSKTAITHHVDLDHSENSAEENVKTPKHKVKSCAIRNTVPKPAQLPHDTSFWSISSTNSKTTVSYDPSNSAKQNACPETGRSQTDLETRSVMQDAHFRPVNNKRARRPRNPSRNSLTDNNRPQNTKVFLESTLSHRLTNQLLKRSKYYQDILIMTRSQDETGYNLTFPDANTANLFMSTKTGSELDTFVKRPPNVPVRSVDFLLSNLSDKIPLTEIIEEIEEEYLIPIQSIYRLTRKTPDGIEYNTNTVKITISTEHEEYLINACKMSGDSRHQQLCLKLFCGIHPLTYAQPKIEPPQCTRCWRFMHSARLCKNPVRCKICALNHPYSVCPHRNSDCHNFDKCANCGGTHRATWSKCIKYQECLQAMKFQLKKNREMLPVPQKATLESYSLESEQAGQRQQKTVPPGEYSKNEQQLKSNLYRSASGLTENATMTANPNARKDSETESTNNKQRQSKIRSPPKTYAQRAAQAEPPYRLTSPPVPKDRDAGEFVDGSQSLKHTRLYGPPSPKPQRQRNKKENLRQQADRGNHGQADLLALMPPTHTDTPEANFSPAQTKRVTYTSHNSPESTVEHLLSPRTRRLFSSEAISAAQSNEVKNKTQSVCVNPLPTDFFMTSALSTQTQSTNSGKPPFTRLTNVTHPSESRRIYDQTNTTGSHNRSCNTTSPCAQPNLHARQALCEQTQSVSPSVDLILRNLRESLDAFSHPQFNGLVGIVQYISLLNLAYDLLQRIVATITPQFPLSNNLTDHLRCQ